VGALARVAGDSVELLAAAALGGLCIGIIRALNDGYFSTTWTDVVLFAILILVLVFRPTGLLGVRVPEK